MLNRFKHQQSSIEFFRDQPRGLDLSDAGTGKTRTQIDLFAERRANGGKCALVIAPKSLLEAAWGDDILKFAPHLEVSIAYAHNRQKAFDTNADLYITNTDATNWLAKQPDSFFERFDTLIIDELSTFKHRTSNRSKALAKIRKHFKFRYGLTGTPNSNSILDIWHQAFVIDDGERLSDEYFRFRYTTTTPRQVGPSPQMMKWEDKPGASTAVANLLADIAVRYRLEECHDIPENHIYKVPFTLSSEMHKAYKEMERHAILMLEDGKVIDAVNAAVVTQKLLQIASGAIYDESGSIVHLENSRYKLVRDLVAARNHSLVFFIWKHQARFLEKLLKEDEIPYCKIDGTTKDKAKVVREFQQGYYQVCLAQPQSAAHGLTLTRATTAIWASPTYNLEHFIQGNHRIYRAGQDRKTETILVTAKGTIEPRVDQILTTKDRRQMDFLHMLQELAQ
jgi:SNF2 family DNA or RNA helicase